MTGHGIHQGGCHCGNVRFEAETALTRLISWNCSHCAKRGPILAFVPAEKFKLLKGEDNLIDYHGADSAFRLPPLRYRALRARQKSRRGRNGFRQCALPG